MIERTLLDYYRCPEHFVKMSLAGDLSPGSGYFRFGSDICYGQSARGPLSRVPSTALVDVLPDAIAADGLLRVPFDPSQVIDNLRLERYATDSWRSTNPVRQMPWLKSYYSLRRYMPSRLRLQLQRTYFRNWKSLTFPAGQSPAALTRFCSACCVCHCGARGSPGCRSYGSGRTARRAAQSSPTTCGDRRRTRPVFVADGPGRPVRD